MANKERFMDKRVSDLIPDIVAKVCFLKKLNSKDKAKSQKSHKIYNKETEQFLKRSCDVTELKKGKVWNVETKSFDKNKAEQKAFVNYVESNLQHYLKNKC